MYRSSDAGRTWRQLPIGVLPTTVAPAHAPGALYVPQTRHAVAPPFVAAYRRLGLPIVGYPVTEAYMEGDAPTQDFERLRLQVRRGRVVVAHLGAALYPSESSGDLGPYGRVAPAPSPRRYFLQTGHAVRGEFLRYWEEHDGVDLFGAPISDIKYAPNSDGSGRVYAMQWFEKVRLEWHPEAGGAVLLGLLGSESLYIRGWLPPHAGEGSFYWSTGGVPSNPVAPSSHQGL